MESVLQCGWSGFDVSLTLPLLKHVFFYKLPKVYTKPHETHGKTWITTMIITMFTDGGGLHDG